MMTTRPGTQSGAAAARSPGDTGAGPGGPGSGDRSLGGYAGYDGTSSTISTSSSPDSPDSPDSSPVVGISDLGALLEMENSGVVQQKVFETLKTLYQKKVRPLEVASRYAHFHSAPLSPADFDAKPMVKSEEKEEISKPTSNQSTHTNEQTSTPIRLPPPPFNDIFLFSTLYFIFNGIFISQCFSICGPSLHSYTFLKGAACGGLQRGENHLYPQLGRAGLPGGPHRPRADHRPVLRCGVV